MSKISRVLSTGVIAGLVLTGQVAQLTTVFVVEYQTKVVSVN